MMSNFVASTHYNDFNGTTAADHADLNNVNSWLHERHYIKDNEVLFGIYVSLGLVDIQEQKANIKFLVTDLGGSSDIPSFLQDHQGDIIFREIIQEMNISEFLAFFKQFSFTLSSVDGVDGISYNSLI